MFSDLVICVWILFGWFLLVGCFVCFLFELGFFNPSIHFILLQKIPNGFFCTT